ncbi:MAG: hypothetical protein JWM19_6615 [Actinomycetia bacterium]|nr:hypothetical protein [Actinomycetes bacterium]
MPQPDPVRLEGPGIRLLYTPSILRVGWENGCEVMIRQPGGSVTAAVDQVHMAADFVILELRVNMKVPGPGYSTTYIKLSFPGTASADVQRLADLINTAQLGTDGPGTEAPEAGSASPGAPGPSPATPAHGPDPGTPPHGPDPGAPQRGPGSAGQSSTGRVRSSQPATPQPGQQPPAPPPVIMFRPDVSAWANDPDWIGLFPPVETARLMEVPASGQARGGSSPPSA